MYFYSDVGIQGWMAHVSTLYIISTKASMRENSPLFQVSTSISFAYKPIVFSVLSTWKCAPSHPPPGPLPSRACCLHPYKYIAIYDLESNGVLQILFPEMPVPKCHVASKTVSLGLFTKESSQIALESPYRPILLMATNSLLARMNLYRMLC